MKKFLRKIHESIVTYMDKSYIVDKYLIAKVKEDDGIIYDCIYCTIIRNAVLFALLGGIFGFVLGYITGIA